MFFFWNDPVGSSHMLSTIAKDETLFRCMSKRYGDTSFGMEGTPYKPINEAIDEFGMHTNGETTYRSSRRKRRVRSIRSL